MQISDASKAIFQMLRYLPNWSYAKDRVKGSYAVSWTYLPFYKKHVEKVCQSTKLQQRIVDKCQFVLDSGQFEIDTVEITFSQEGLTIGVRPGNACYIGPGSMGGVGNHNIDNPAQCFSLLFLLITALGEIYSMMSVWEDEPQCSIDREIGDKVYRLERSLRSKPFKLFEMQDGLDVGEYVYARTRREATEFLEQIGLPSAIYGFAPLDPMIVSTDQVFVVEVIFKEGSGLGPKRYSVIALDPHEAEDLVAEMFEHSPSLYPIESIVACEKSAPITPAVFSLLWPRPK